MKKISSILLVLALASTMIFASFSGSASVNLGYNMDSSEYGFINSDSAKASFELFKIVAEKEGDQDVAVRLKAGLAASWSFGGSNGAPMTKQKDQKFLVKFDTLVAEIFSGDVWLIGITGMNTPANYATSSLDKMTDKDGNAGKVGATARMNVPTTAGIYGKVMGFKVSVGAHGWIKDTNVPWVDDADHSKGKKEQHAAAVTFETPEFEFVEGLKTQATVNYGLTKKVGTDANHTVGGGVKVSYEVEDMGKVSVATDAYFNTQDVVSAHKATGNKFGVDAALTVDFAPVTLDVFYANLYMDNYQAKTYNDQLVSAQVVTNLNKYEVPLKITVWAKDVLKVQDLGVKVETTLLEEALTIAVKGGVKLNYDLIGTKATGNEKWNAGLDVTYKHEYFTAKAGASVSAPFKSISKTNLVLGAYASVTTDKLVEGATFGIKYSDGEDLLKTAADGKKELGKINLFCTIAW